MEGFDQAVERCHAALLEVVKKEPGPVAQMFSRARMSPL
jgi:hypothetical protein